MQAREVRVWLLLLGLACGPGEPPELVVEAPQRASATTPSRSLGDPTAPPPPTAHDAIVAFLGSKPAIPAPLAELTLGLPTPEAIATFERLKHPQRPPFRDADASDPRILLGSSLEQHAPGVGFTLFVDTTGPGLIELQLSLPQVHARPSLEKAWGKGVGEPPVWVSTSPSLRIELLEGGPADDKAVLRFMPGPVATP